MNKLYGRLARTNLKNNKPLYIPYILAGVMTVALFYLMVFLNNNPGLDQMRGGYYIKTIMGMGVYIIAFFSLIFLFYTNSFIIKRRKREIGVYNILGMENAISQGYFSSKLSMLRYLPLQAVCSWGSVLPS